jgi:hypothetical protein
LGLMISQLATPPSEPDYSATAGAGPIDPMRPAPDVHLARVSP